MKTMFRTFDALVAVSELMHERDPQQDGASTSVRAEVISTLYQRASATSYRTVAELARYCLSNRCDAIISVVGK